MTPYTDSATNALALISHLLVFSTFFVGQQISSGVVPNDSLEVGGWVEMALGWVYRVESS